MADIRLSRIQRIEGNIFQLGNLNPFLMPPKNVLRDFIDELLRDMVAEAIDLRKEKDFREAAVMLHRSLLVYVDHVYPLRLEKPEDEVRIMEIRIFKATMSVFAGIFHWAFGEAQFVAHHMQINPAYADRRREAQLILTVAKAGMDLLKYREGKLSRIELMRQQKTVHRLNGTGQEAMVELMTKELARELGPYVEASEATVNQSPTPDPEWIPEYVKKHQERVEANKAKKQEKKKKSRSRPSRNRTDSATYESPDDQLQQEHQEMSTKSGMASSDAASEASYVQPTGSGDNRPVKKSPVKAENTAQPTAAKETAMKRTAAKKTPQQKINKPAQTVVGGYNGLDSFGEAPAQHVEPHRTKNANGQQGRQTPTSGGQRSSPKKLQRPEGNKFSGLDSFDDHIEAHEHVTPRRGSSPQRTTSPARGTPTPQGPIRGAPSPQRPMSPARGAQSPTPQTRPVKELAPPSLQALSPATQSWLQIFQFKLACPTCFPKTPHCEGIYAFTFLPRLNHPCSHDILICQLKSLGEQFWGRIRQRTNLQYMGAFRICLNFFKGTACLPSYNLCHFAHSKEEMMIWEADRDRKFNGKELVTFLRNQEIHQRAKQQQQQQRARTPQQTPQEPSRSPQPGAPSPNHQQPPAPTRGGDTPAKAEPVRKQEPSRPAPAMKGSLTPQKVPKKGKKGKQSLMQAPAKKDEKKSGGTQEAKQPESKSKRLVGGFTSERAQEVLHLIQSMKGNFVYCCSQCFHASPPRISVQHQKEASKCTNNERRHDWTIMNKLLVFFDYTRGLSKIRPRPPRKPAKVFLCWHRMRQHGCAHGDACGFAHSEVEVDFWLFEHMFHYISRDEVVEISEAVHRPRELPTMPAQTPKPPTPSTSPSAPAPSMPAPALVPSAPYPIQSAPKPIPPFQRELRILCGICYPRVITERSERNPKTCGSSSPHPWGVQVVYEIYTGLKRWVRVFPRHPKLRLGVHPTICWRRMKCDHRGIMNQQCLFPHYQEEKDLWIYQAQHKLLKIEDVVDVQRGGNASSSRQSQSQARCTARMPTEGTGTTSQFVCTYCKQVFDEKWHLEQHLKSPQHIAKMNSDQEKRWQHRDPPAQVTNGNYKMCRYNTAGMCRYSRKPDDENLCDSAHSEEELREWEERHKYRMMKMDKVREQRLFSFLDELIQTFNFTNKKEEVMMKELPGVEVSCVQQLEVTIPYEERSEEGSYSKQWEFQVTVSSDQKKLKRIGLLYDEHRHYFYLSHPSGEERPQICPGSRLVIDTNDRNRYSFQVLFTSNVLGRFHQWVVFDFGSKPVMYVPLLINIGSEQIEPHLVESSTDIKESWNENNSVIIEYPAGEQEDPFYQFLRVQYPPPLAGQVKLNEDHQMTHHNVKDHFHKMLILEELACNERLKKFSGRTRLELCDAITEGMYQKASEGQLFGKISLSESLLDDSEASQIVVSNVCFALLKFDETANVVYQARILTEKYMDLRTQDSIYISLSEQCIREQGLDANKKNLKILVQFQLERIPFCEMHFGVDNVTEMTLLYPPANMVPRFPKVTREQCGRLQMNPRQAAASTYIVQAHKSLPFVPGPTMIIGPFGTGKTWTMAKTMIGLLRQSPMNKILVCTHSNSAADWLVTYYLHPFLLERQRMDASSKRKLLRVYATVKSPASVDQVILDNYAIFKEGTNNGCFRKPTFRDILDCNIVVVTLATSIHLVALNEEGRTIKGFFEHIFIDEAAQALETEVFIPLGLAVRETLVVMAGDHIQMRPKVYSEVARKHRFHMSMLERLFYWEKSYRCNNVCFLTYNYRMVDEILRFIARYHYQCKLVTKSNHYRHPDYHPMSFLTVKGTDQLIGTSYVNTAEVNAIVEQVQELVQRWPSRQWGEEYNIAVLTPYRLQVELIRKKLRKQGLDDINVESVQNVQGKEFKAVFISTVRTRNTLNKAQITAISSSGQGSYNEQFYYGFLSDEGELITAFTRCQCLLYVVGDPVALCSVGDCHGTWEKYIKECENNFSLYPPGITLQSIKQEIQAAKQMLNPSANTFQPPPIPSLMSPPIPAEEGVPATESAFPKAPAPVSVWVKGPPRNIPKGTSNLGERVPSSSVLFERLSSVDFPSLHQANQEAPEDEFGDYQEELDIDDEILKELRIQVKKDEKVYKEREFARLPSKDATIWEALEEASEDEEPVKGGAKDDDDNDSFILEISDDEADSGHSSGLTPPSEEKTSLDEDDEYLTDKAEINKEGETQQTMPRANFRMIERDGDIFLIRHNRDTSELKSAKDYDAYDSDEEKDFLETELNEDKTDVWLSRTVEEPDDYKVCIIRFEPSGRVYAILADGSSAEEIVISSKRRRERALDGDKVVMHILSETDGDYEIDRDSDAPRKMYGEVKHILERSIHPKFKKVVCTIDPVNHDLMCPVDRSFPKMFPMGRTKEERLQSKGHPEFQIYNIFKGKFERARVVKVKYADIPNKLFVVQYYEWFPNTAYPVGIVTEELPPCDSPKNALRILKLMHGVKDQWPPHFAKEIEDQFPKHWEIPKEELIVREEGDFTNKAVFTVDPPDAQDLDDALHVERLNDGMMRVGVHIADVSYFIAKDSPLDEEARKRGTTFYPAFYAFASHMLPSQFSTSLCSLLPDTEKLTLSVIFMFDRDGKQIGDPQILRSIICPVERLSYETVEQFLLNQTDGCPISEQVKRQILDLHNLTSYLRTQRLGEGRFFYQPDESNADVTCTMAHTLVEEMMICANEAVAKFLVNRYGMNVPVRHQPPPDRTKAQEWLTNYGKDSDTSFRLSSIMPKIKQVIKESQVVRPDEGDRREDEEDRNSLAGSDVSDFSTEGGEEVVEGVPVTQITWNNIMRVLDNINHTNLDFQKIIGKEGGHPKQAVALSQLYRIMAFGRYSCANDLVKGCGHFDLQKDFYTHFTSPIRRYIDLVVHRMVTAGIGGEDAPYTPRELDDICHHCNNQSSKAKKYGAMSRCLLSALKLKLAAEPKLSFVEAADDRGLQVIYPHERYLRTTQSSTSIPLKLLKPAKKPEDGEGPNSVRLHFKNSVYDLVSTIPELRGLGAFLKTNRFVQTLPLASWNEILTCLREEDLEGLEDLLYELKTRMENGSLAINTQSSRIAEVTCEVQSRNQAGEDMAPKKYAEFKCDFNPGQVIQVQLASGIQKGLLVPKLQLVSLTPKFSFCVEHRGSPVECFARLADKPPERCRTITQYVESWLPVVDMMVVYNTVSGDETTFIRDIQIQWYKVQEPDSMISICGCFSLDKDWCNDRQVRFFSRVNKQKGKKCLADKKKDENQESEFEEILSRDYLCIRIDGYHVAPNVQFKMKSLEQKPGLVSSNLTNPHCGTMTLVVHGLTTSVSDERRGGNESVNVEFKVHQNACDIPKELFDQDKGTTRCTVELIPKSQPDRRMEDAVYKLQDTKTVRNLIRHICLQRSVQVMNNVEDSDVVSKYLLRAGSQFNLTPPPRHSIFPPNESQAAAIRIALSNTFAVIQGPPGTGKTRTGAFLAYYFHLINRGLHETQKGQLPQILYCGPSNKSVDVIAEYLKEFMSDDFSIVRVYSETIQQQEFPIPGMGSAERKFGSGGQEARMEPSLRNLSLHHRIRAPHAPYADRIRDYERKFADRNLRMTKRTRKDIKDYKNLLKAAEKSELPKHQVVLATCNASGRVNLKQSVNIVQLIIDEAGMCSEPESLIPMVTHNPSQVVLIGDHMQLSPIIQEPHAMELGAGKSLMEKYEARAHTLNIQYRMHEEICHFPSNAFYQGQLQTAPAVLNRNPDLLTERIWPNGPEYPRVFCHVVGVEDTLTVRSAEGNEMSKSNPQEVVHVVRIVDYFINHLGVKPQQLVVLSQYRLQCAQISEQLGKTGLKDIAVATVIKSQGSEWDYVIFSTVRSMAKIEIEDRPGKGWKIRHLGFTMDENQMNVAMSRARRGHIVVGNKFLLGTLPKWSDLLQAYKDTNSLLPAKGFPRNVYPRRR